MSSVLLETLIEYKIQDRVFGPTTDNALNNKTLVDSLQQVLSDNVNLTRTPRFVFGWVGHSFTDYVIGCLKLEWVEQGHHIRVFGKFL